MRAVEDLGVQTILRLDKPQREEDKCTKIMIMVLKSEKKYQYLDMVELMQLMMLIRSFMS